MAGPELVVRGVSDADLDAFARIDLRAFGSAVRRVERHVEHLRAGLELDRLVTAVDGDRPVGTGGAFSMELTLPGNGLVPVAGVTWIAVAATHRRRGAMAAMMDALVTQARDRGEPAMVLCASEGSIYGHVGYGPATSWSATRIDPRRVAFRSDVGDPGGARYVEPEDAVEVLAPLFDRLRVHVPGEVSRPDHWWRTHSVNADDAPTSHVVVVEDAAGVAQAYADYRLEERWGDGHPEHRVDVSHLGAATPAAHAALWRFLLSIDLVGEVHTLARPADDPLPLLLVDPRQVRTSDVIDGLWVRILDVAGFFGARRYAVSDELVVDVASPDAAVAGRWRIGGDGTGAEVARTDAPADLAMDSSTLGSLSLGGPSACRAHLAGLVEELHPGAVDRLARFLRCDPAPFCGTVF